jgi:hypothetical protein
MRPAVMGNGHPQLRRERPAELPPTALAELLGE